MPSQRTKRIRQSQNPTHILNYHSAPILTPPLSPPTTPITDTATWLWNYKHVHQNLMEVGGPQITRKMAYSSCGTATPQDNVLPCLHHFSRQLRKCIRMMHMS
eukprot:1143892-Pelagomonas_calceolata.AAC.5